MKLGFDVSERSISHLMPRRRTPPSQTWRTFLKNHLGSAVAVDFFAVPTLTVQILFVFVVLAHGLTSVRTGLPRPGKIPTSNA